MANLLVAFSHGRSIGTLGAKSSPSGASKLALGPRSAPYQIRHRFKIVANAATGSPAYRLTEEEGKEPKASWWDTTPLDHAENYVASYLYPMPNRQIRAAIFIRRVGIFWVTWVPLLIWLCSGLRVGFIPAVFFVIGVATVAMYLNKFCAWRINLMIKIKESKRLSERHGH